MFYSDAEFNNEGAIMGRNLFGHPPKGKGKMAPRADEFDAKDKNE